MIFNSHIDEIYKTGNLMYLNRIGDSFDTPTRVMVVQSLALSMINYCSIIWGATTKEQMERVQKLQNVAAKVDTKIITVRGPQVWNQIPAEIRNTASLSKFKDRLKKFMICDFKV